MQKMALRHIFRAILETGGGGEGGSVNLIKQKRGGGKVGRGREREMCSAWRSFLPGGFCNNEEHTQVPYSTATRGRGKEGGGIMVHQGGGGGSIPLCCNSEKAIAGEKSRGGRGDRTKKGNGGRGNKVFALSSSFSCSIYTMQGAAAAAAAAAAAVFPPAQVRRGEVRSIMGLLLLLRLLRFAGAMLLGRRSSTKGRKRLYSPSYVEGKRELPGGLEGNHKWGGKISRSSPSMNDKILDSFIRAFFRKEYPETLASV